jgi:2-keto-4-pentenoate hydratase/2-oxohepta-3-ene-1,7-dioic acid hydratase in catechol pathway
MKVVRFSYRNKISWGTLDDNKIRVFTDCPWNSTLKTQELSLKKVTLLAPYDGGKIILAGLNYKDHAREMNMPIPKEPVIFMKPATAVIGHDAKIIYPTQSKNVHYEAELAFIIGKKAKNVKSSQAAKYIFGYTCLNDVTARDLQAKDGQWTRAKGFDTFCPLGPFIDTTYDWQRKNIRLYLNGLLKQDSTTSNVIFNPSRLLAFISTVMTLYPGDIISTGTPWGVGPMRRGDTVEVVIVGLGRLTNKVT